MIGPAGSIALKGWSCAKKIKDEKQVPSNPPIRSGLIEVP